MPEPTGAETALTVLYIMALLVVPALFIMAMWRIGTAFHRMANGFNHYLRARFPDYESSHPPK